jgi:zinc protease
MTVAPRPTVAPAPRWSFPEVTDRSLPSGLRVRTVHLPGQHVVSVRVAVPFSLTAEPRDREGVALVMARCLDEGTGTSSAEQMAQRIEGAGIALGAGVGERGLVLEVEVPASRLADALDLVAECLVDPVFPEAEVARLVRSRVADIAHERADAGSRAALEFIGAYFDAGARASRSAGGARETVAKVTARDVRDFHAAVVHPDRAVVVVAGDVSGMPDAPDELVARALTRWALAGAAPEPAPEADVLTPVGRAGVPGRVVLVDRPGAAQSELFLGRPGPDRRTPHGWGAYQVLAFLLGGSPQARIDAVMREQRGYTYGIRAGFRPRRRGGICVVSGAVRADATVEALTALGEVLALTGADLTDAEVRHAADFVGKTAPGRFATADAVADEVVRLALDDLDVDTVTRTLEQVRTLTRPQVAAAWDEVREGPGWTTVVVADACRHAEGLASTGFGEVTVVPF